MGEALDFSRVVEAGTGEGCTRKTEELSNQSCRDTTAPHGAPKQRFHTRKGVLQPSKEVCSEKSLEKGQIGGPACALSPFFAATLTLT